MKIKSLVKLLCLSSLPLLAAPSSIDALGLPEAPENRYNLEEFESVLPDALIWYTFYTYFNEGGEEVKHGLWIERTRSRDRERYNRDYMEVRRIYYHGKISQHAIESTWIGGVLRQRDYILSENLVITIRYNEQGQEEMGPKANARAGRAKRERITRVFDEVYKLNN
jgi:hypothetical protein